MVQLFAATPANTLPPVPRYNVCPTQPVSVVISRQGQRHYGPLRWGLIPHWYQHPTDGPLLINARSETIAEKPAFSDAARKRRCLIPASGYFEWTKEGETRLPWYVTREDNAPMVFAGIWQNWVSREGAQVASCAIVTAEATGQLAELHHRVPVVLEPDDWPLWLGEAGHGAARLMTGLADGALTAARVAPAVNARQADGPELIEPI